MHGITFLALWRRHEGCSSAFEFESKAIPQGRSSHREKIWTLVLVGTRSLERPPIHGEFVSKTRCSREDVIYEMRRLICEPGWRAIKRWPRTVQTVRGKVLRRRMLRQQQNEADDSRTDWDVVELRVGCSALSHVLKSRQFYRTVNYNLGKLKVRFVLNIFVQF